MVAGCGRESVSPANWVVGGGLEHGDRFVQDAAFHVVGEVLEVELLVEVQEAVL